MEGPGKYVRSGDENRDTTLHDRAPRALVRRRRFQSVSPINIMTYTYLLTNPGPLH